ncbi:RNA polymerase sigma factor [Variovorax sp. J31P207]|uniref:RNA polymerase sigma factor n=1 Tax=Variovorax sp. J31P207 TaxID=3053510 RepID=UPI0025782949|nr:RNA polymerase sigma factor [Variovorax sp. J31P207]MDM0068184.1 RNA polymerase sigma factor [Variovorax sp. J31P207]
MASSGPEAPEALIATLEEARRQFLALVDDIRPDLHRYATRMTGSVADGEDVVQDTLARACFELAQHKAMPPLRPWLFRIAHNRAIDHWRREAHRRAEPLEAALELADDAALEPDNALAREQAVRAALRSFLQLAPAQRGCVILKDVLDHSLEEIAAELELSVPAVKAALHRGRGLLRQLPATTPDAAPARTATPELLHYARLFNARDWDGVRALLADDVRLDLVSRRKAAGRREVGVYFSNYERLDDWRLVPAWLDGRAVLAVLPGRGDGPPGYFIELQWRDGWLCLIRDFRHVPYIARDADLVLAP